METRRIFYEGMQETMHMVGVKEEAKQREGRSKDNCYDATNVKRITENNLPQSRPERGETCTAV